MNNLSKYVGIGALTLVLAGCGEPPKKIRTIGPNHFYIPKKIAAIHYGGFIRCGNDLDFDADNMNDLYIITKNGPVLHTLSRRLLDGEDTATDMTWETNDSIALKYTRKGDYPSI